MLQREKKPIRDNSELIKELLEIKNSAYNPVMVAEVRKQAEALDKELGPFDGVKFKEQLEQFPSLKYLHFFLDSDD